MGAVVGWLVGEADRERQIRTQRDVLFIYHLAIGGNNSYLVHTGSCGTEFERVVTIDQGGLGRHAVANQLNAQPTDRGGGRYLAMDNHCFLTRRLRSGGN